MATAPVTVTANLNFNPASLNAAGKQVQSAFGNINLPTKSANAFNNSLGRITGQASEFDKSINAATARVFAFGAAVSIINGISTAFKALVSSTIEVEKRLTEISSILGGSVQQLNQFKTAIFDVAKNTGQTFATVADGASELARQGLSAEETVKRLNAALILTRVSGLDAEGSVNALTSAINGFTSAGLTAEQIVNKLIAVDTAFAVSAKDLAEAFSRAGSTAEDAGVSFDELLGLVTSVQQTTARGGAVIGNAFKSIFSRLSRGTVIEDLQALGVEINASQTGVQKLQALSQALSKISDPTQANAIKELAGGVYQINVVSAALKDLSSETSIFGQASQTASQASNEAFEKNAQLNQTLASQINKLVQGLTELGSKIGELTIAPVIENLLTGANKLLDILNKVFDPEEGNKLIQGFFKGVGAFIAGPGLVLVSAAFFKLFQVVAKFAKEGISDLFKIGSEQERIKNIEGGIVALLQQDANLRAILLSTSSSQAQKEQAVINSIKQQNALLAQQQALVNSIAVASAKAGVGGFSPSGGFSKRKGKGMFAAGYSGGVSPEEAAMEMAAANQHGYKAGKVKKERIFDGSGSSFMGILNSAETRKDFINGSGYKSTLITPPNGFAASGFVPNFGSKAGSKNYSNTKSVGLKDPNSKMSLKDVEDEILRLEALKNKDPNFSNDQQKKLDNLFLSQKLKKERLENEQGEDGGPKLGSKKRPLEIKAENYAFLIPNINKTYEPDRLLGSGSIDKWKNIKNLNYILSPTQLAGPQSDSKITEEKEASIAKEAMENIISTAISYSKKLSNPLMDQPIGPSEIYEKLKQGGNKGSYGAVQGAAGAAFEAVITQGLGIQGEAGQAEGGDWDAKSVPDKLKQLFGITKGVTSADFKVSTSESSIESYAKKILNDKENDYKKLLGVLEEEEDGIKKPATKRARRGGKASGFIPNFAALNDAISREMAAGIPRDKIYIDQDDSLKSPLNKQGLSVANEYDEPNGVKDGIKRAISEGKNPKTYGKATARGFIPNYSAGVGIKLLSFFGRFGDDVLKVGAKSSKTAKSLDVLGGAAETTAKKTALGKFGEAAKQEGKSQLSNLASLSLFTLIPQISFSLEDLKKDLNDFGGSIGGTSELLNQEASLREGFVNQLEKERSKEKPDESKIKEIEGLIASSQNFSNNLENDPVKTEKSLLLVMEEFTGLVSLLNGIGVLSDKNLEQIGPRGEEIANESTGRKLLQPFLTASLGDVGRDALYKYVGQYFEDSGAGGEYYSRGSWTDAEDRGKKWDDPTRQMRNNDIIGEYINRGYSLSEEERSDGTFSDQQEQDGERNFLVNAFEDKKSTLSVRRQQTSDELAQAKTDLTSNPNRGEAEKRIQQLTYKLEKIDSAMESLDTNDAWKDFVNNFAKGVDARMAGESPLAKGVREARGEGLSVAQYEKLSNQSIEQGEIRLRIALEAREIRKEIDRVKGLFEKETVSFKFDVKNVRSQLERTIDEVSFEGSAAQVEMQGDKNELRKRANRSMYSDYETLPTVTSGERMTVESYLASQSSEMDKIQFKRKDALIGQASSDKFADVFTELSKNLNSSGRGNALLERERAKSDLISAQVALKGASSEDQEAAQQRVDQLTANLSQIDSNIASRKDTAADATPEGEIQRNRLQKIQESAKILNSGDKNDQKQALEDIFKNLEGLNLEGGGSEIKEKILEAAAEVSKERTELFIEQEKARYTNQLDLLEKQKGILNEFISKFNASFKENIKGTRDSFISLTRNQRPVAQNAAALAGAKIGGGETDNAQVISARLNAANRITQTFDDQNFSGLVSPEQLAQFRSQTTSQIVSGRNFTALENVNEQASINLQNKIKDGGFNEEEKSAVTQVAKGSLRGVASDIANSGDSQLASRGQELQSLLSNPEASIGKILEAVEGLNIDSSNLSEGIQIALQEKVATALGAIGGITSSVEGNATVTQSKSVNASIAEFSQTLEAFTSAIPENKFPDIVKTLESNTDLLQTAIGSITTKFDNLDEASIGLEGSLKAFKKVVDSFKPDEEKDTQKLTAMAEALEAVRAATRKLKPDNSGPKEVP